jgi:uncharacterized protein YtpQ (UPF0354 family)
MRLQTLSLVNILASLAASICLFATAPAGAAAPDGTTSRANLMAVLRESPRMNKLDASLTPVGKQTMHLPDGKTVDVEMAHFNFIGDMHVRFVFDGPLSMRNASPQELQALNLTADEALSVAVANIRRVYGNPAATSWSGALMTVSGKSPDLDSSYFLDSAFWNALSMTYPGGVVVAVPKRGGLLFVSAADAAAVGSLRKAIPALYASSGGLRISSALYLFKDGKWSVFQAPLKE